MSLLLQRPDATPRIRAMMQELFAVLADLCHGFADTYHPERHYMRGPGPKWRARHGAVLAPIRVAGSIGRHSGVSVSSGG